MKGIDMAVLMKRVLELVRPDLRSYYRMPVKGRVVKSYASDGNYWADVQPTRNDESDDETMPVIPQVEMPVLWGGPQRGLACPPPTGTRVVVSFFDGDPGYPFISHVRWHKNKAPACEVGAFVIQMEPGCHIKFDQDKNILTVTPADWTVEADGTAKITAGSIVLDSDVTITKTLTVAGQITGDGVTLGGGNINADGTIMDASGNSNHHSH